MSVLEQDFSDFELIIVDDGSTDLSYSKALEIIDSRITIIRQPNQGVSKARNAGVAVSRASYVAFLDADDSYSPTFLSHMINMTTSFPSAAFYCCRFEVIDEKGYLIRTESCLPKQFCGPVEDFFTLYMRDRFLLCPSSFMVNKTMFVKINGFPDDASIGEDIFLWTELALQGSVVVNNVVASTMFRNAENRTATKASQTIAKYADYYLRNTSWQNGLSEKQISSVYALVCYYAFIQACVALSVEQKANAMNYAQLIAPHNKIYSFIIRFCNYFLPGSFFRVIQVLRNRLNRV